MANSILGNSGATPQIDNNMLQQFKQFKQTFKGNPKQTVMHMLKSGQITNPQLQQAMNMANQFKHMFK